MIKECAFFNKLFVGNTLKSATLSIFVVGAKVHAFVQYCDILFIYHMLVWDVSVSVDRPI